MPTKKSNTSELLKQLDEAEKAGIIQRLPNDPFGIHAELKPVDKPKNYAVASLPDNISATSKVIIANGMDMHHKLTEALKLANKDVVVISSDFRTEDEHKLMLANQKHHKSLHNLPQGYHNVPTLVDKEPNSEDLHKNSVDDSKDKKYALVDLPTKELDRGVTFTIKNPYAPIEPIEEAEYYKQNAEYYLKEYQLIQQKQSKLSSTKRRKIVEIVEKYLLT